MPDGYGEHGSDGELAVELVFESVVEIGVGERVGTHEGKVGHHLRADHLGLLLVDLHAEFELAQVVTTTVDFLHVDGGVVGYDRGGGYAGSILVGQRETCVKRQAAHLGECHA